MLGAMPECDLRLSKMMRVLCITVYTIKWRSAIDWCLEQSTVHQMVIANILAVVLLAKYTVHQITRAMPTIWALHHLVRKYSKHWVANLRCVTPHYTGEMLDVANSLQFLTLPWSIAPPILLSEVIAVLQPTSFMRFSSAIVDCKRYGIADVGG